MVLKVLSLTYKDNTSGGPYAVAVDHKNSLDRNKFYVKIFNPDSIRLINLVIDRKRIKFFLNKFDLIHVHNLFNIKNMLIISMAEKLSIPSVLSLHGNLNKWSMKKKYFLKLIYLKFFKRNINSLSLLHFLNYKEKEEASKFFDIQKIPNRIIQNFIDVSKFKILRNRDSIFKILFFGRLDIKKNYLILPEIAFFFKEENISDVKFIIVGPGKKKNFDNLKSKIKDLGVESFFEIRESINSIAQKNNLFSEIDIFILPSEDEADSVSIKESLASGKPVVISKECKIESYDGNKDFIKVIGHKSAKIYYEELIKFYNNRETLKNLSNKIKSYSESNFSIEILKKLLPNLYKKCVSHKHNLK